ncbi:MAG: hypothetical protein ACE5GG_00370 [Candidatus Omnitrophota bacterium]
MDKVKNKRSMVKGQWRRKFWVGGFLIRPRRLRLAAQNTAEYAIVIGLVVAAVMAMQTYVKRGFQGRVASASDNFVSKLKGGDWETIGGGSVTWTGNQWEPEKLSSRNTRQVNAGTTSTETLDLGGTLTRTSTLITQQKGDSDGKDDGDYREYTY